MTSILKISIILFALILCMSCEVKKPAESEIKTEPIKLIEVDPFRMVSMGLQHSFGLEIKLETINGNSVVVVHELKEKGPAAVMGFKTGMVVESLGGFDLLNLDKTNSDKIIAQIENGEVQITYLDDSNIARVSNLEVTRLNCPQQRNLDFIFVSDTDSRHPPSILVAHFVSKIKPGSFSQEESDSIYFYNSVTGKWWAKEALKDDFSVGVEMDKLTALLSPEVFINLSPDINSGMFAYSGETRFELQYEISNELDMYGKTQIGEGILKANNVLFKGRIMVQDESRYFILPHYEKSNAPEMKPLPSDKTHVSDKASDWIVLFDKSGAVIDLVVDGFRKNWLGTFIPSNTANKNDSSSMSDYLIKDFNVDESEYVNLYDYNMAWFEEFETGYESAPYPDDITISFPDDLDGEIKLKSYAPKYFDKNHRIYLVLSGQFIPADGTPIDIYGFLIRMK